MSLESFYGGKPGISPVIRKSFKYVSEQDPAYTNKTPIEKNEAIEKNEVMETCFAKSDYTDVWYGELAIIDAENRSNPNHGRLYKRTLNRGVTSDPHTPHGEYIGTLAGPAGGLPQTQIKPFASFKSTIPNDGSSYTYPTENGIAVGLHADFNTGIKEQSWNINDKSLVPGKYIDNESGENQYNDKIKYYWVNVVNEYKNKEKNTLYLGFQIPYPVIDFNITSIDWTKNFSSAIVDDENHPFYKEVNLSIPKGVRGNDISNLRKIRIPLKESFDDLNPVEKNEYSIYDFKNFSFNNGFLNLNNNDTSAWLYDWNEIKGKYIWVYDFTAYGKFGEDKFFKTFSCYLGEVNEIENIVMEENGKIKITYSNKDPRELATIKYIQDIQYNNSGITITYNTVGDNGELETVELPWYEIKKLDFDQETGEIKYIVQGIEGTLSTAHIPAIYNATINQDKELIFQKYSGTSKPETIQTGVQLKTINSMDINNGILQITYNTGVPDQIRIAPPSTQIGAELDEERLKAIAFLQNVYYKDTVERFAQNAINTLQNDVSSTKIFSIINNQHYTTIDEGEILNNVDWSLHRKFFNSVSDWNSLKESFYKNSDVIDITNDAINFYPYKKGIPIYKDVTNNSTITSTTQAIELLTKEVSTTITQILYWKRFGFYYDQKAKFWKEAGNWNDNLSNKILNKKQYKDSNNFDSELLSTIHFEQMYIPKEENPSNNYSIYSANVFFPSNNSL